MAKSKNVINSDIIIADLFELKNKVETIEKNSAKIDSYINEHLKQIPIIAENNYNSTQKLVRLMKDNSCVLDKQFSNFKKLQETTTANHKISTESINKIDDNHKSLIAAFTKAELFETSKSLKNLKHFFFYGISINSLIILITCVIQIYFFKSTITKLSGTHYQDGYSTGRSEIINKMNKFLDEHSEVKDKFYEWNTQNNEK